MKQRVFGLLGLFLCLVLVMFFGFEGLVKVFYLKVSFGIVLLGSVYLIATSDGYNHVN